MKTYVIAEIGINHNGDLNAAKRLMDIASVAGCDSVVTLNLKKEIQMFVFQR